MITPSSLSSKYSYILLLVKIPYIRITCTSYVKKHTLRIFFSSRTRIQKFLLKTNPSANYLIVFNDNNRIYVQDWLLSFAFSFKKAFNFWNFNYLLVVVVTHMRMYERKGLGVVPGKDSGQLCGVAPPLHVF